MERTQNNPLENFLSSWNNEFSNYPLNPADLKNSHSVIHALLHVFERLGLDREFILAPPPEEHRNEHTMYYWDLLPVINITRVFNYLVSISPHNLTITIMDFLQPTTIKSHSILLLMFNFMLFNVDQLREISPYEEELFAEIDQVKILENQKNKLLELLNQQAEEKGKRAERLEKLDYDAKKFEEELKQEKEALYREKQELEAIMKENQQLDMLIEQKKAQKDALLAEDARKRALRVYDADDLKSKAEQAAQSVQEVEEKLNSLQVNLMQNENSLNNLQTVKPSLDIANNLLNDIARAAEILKKSECSDLDSDMKEAELNVVNTELSEVQTQLAELQAARMEAAARRHDNQQKRLMEKAALQSGLREIEEKDRKQEEHVKSSLDLIERSKEETLKYEKKKAAGFEEIANIQNEFCVQEKNMEDYLIKKVLEVEKRVSEKMRNK